MLYEKKRTFGRGLIDLSTLAKDTATYAGQAVSTNEATATYLDYEAENQHFPAENTLEVISYQSATSATKGATLSFTLQSSSNGTSWMDEVSFMASQSEMEKDKLIRRFTIPAQTKRYMRLKLVVGTEVFTAGKILALVRPL